MGEKNDLHLPDLHISGFRGIDNLDIPRLGRVTLLVGKNGVGKTTVLDAIRVYAARWEVSKLAEVLDERDEKYFGNNGVPVLNWAGIFAGRLEHSPDGIIQIGKESQPLIIETTALDEEQHQQIAARFGVTLSVIPAIKVTFSDYAKILPVVQVTLHGNPNPITMGDVVSFHTGKDQPADALDTIPFVSFGPNPLTNTDIAAHWDEAVTHGNEQVATDAVRLILGEKLEDIVVLTHIQIPMAKIESTSRRVPLKSLGEGAVRLFGIGLALANAKNGFLLIDEAENGLHYSAQPAFWRMVFQTAEANNVQVIATTHSADCVRGFAQAAVECKDVEGIVIRLERDGSGLYIVDYPEEDLAIAAEQNIEVR